MIDVICSIIVLIAFVLLQMVYAVFILFVVLAVLALCAFSIPFIVIAFCFWWVWEYLNYRK